MTESVSISINPKLQPAEDYYFLRSKGMEFIEQLGSDQWTDYNIHDPGITTLELTCFVISELGYRTGFDVKDFLAESLRRGGFDQAFFSALQILSTCPVTVNDYRKILIDLEGIQNAWLVCKECPCHIQVYGDCEHSILTYKLTSLSVIPKGYYDVLIELDPSPSLGDLNDGKIMHQFSVFLPTRKFSVLIEIRFPTFTQLDRTHPDIGMFMDISDTPPPITQITVNEIWTSRDQLLTDANLIQSIRQPLYADLSIKLNGGSAPIPFKHVPISVFVKNQDKEHLRRTHLEAQIIDKTASGILTSYRRKLALINQHLQTVRSTLHKNRNLDEDFCNIQIINVVDVAVCADIVLTPDADIEQVLANLYFETEQYFNPPVRFYSLQELQQKNIPTEDIFNGPSLQHGFILNDELKESQLKSQYNTSDLINRYMDIKGVVAVRNLVLTRYDEAGNPVLPSEPWTLELPPLSQARLYIQQTKYLFFKNELPFLPANTDEVNAIYQALKGRHEQLKLATIENDLPIPQGKERNFSDYYPLQYSFPMNYGVGEFGLPSNVTTLRKAQARQFKGYLLFYEQLLANSFAQLQHFPELFRLQSSLPVKSYATTFLNNSLIPGIEDLYDGLSNNGELYELVESKRNAEERKNTMLNHLMARFGEQFSEYILLLNTLDGKSKASGELIRDKVNFLKNYPEISKCRGKAFNYLEESAVCGWQNISGLKKRLGYLLGLDSIFNYFDFSIERKDKFYEAKMTFEGVDGNVILHYQAISDKTKRVLMSKLYSIRNLTIAFISDNANFTPPTQHVVGEWKFELRDPQGNLLATSQAFPSQTEAQTALQNLQDWVDKILSHAQFFIVEHLLLAPKLPGQLLLPVCLDKNCQTCGEEDPYSFRLTFVMPGWYERFQNLDFRRFAERTIRLETPAHLLPKICWVGNDICRESGREVILCNIRNLLENHLEIPKNEEILRAICHCAEAVLEAYNAAFRMWTSENNPEDYSSEDLRQIMENLFQEAIPLASLDCHDDLDPAYYDQLKALIIEYFQDKANCFQFNTFRKAWCAWLEAQVSIDWSLPGLAERVEKFLKNFQGKDSLQHDSNLICSCTKQYVAGIAEKIRSWLEEKYTDTISDADWEELIRKFAKEAWKSLPPDCKTLVSGGQHSKLYEAIINYYADKLPLLQKHAAVLNIFRQLKSIYPPASLHDCEEGSDVNPVRLDQTIIGS